MRVCSFVFLFYPILFCCLLATRPVWAEWQGNPPLKNEYNEHEFLAACREGNVHAVEFYLADEDFDPNTYLRSGISKRMVTGLYIAAQNGHDEVVQTLADNERVNLNQIKDDRTPVYIASENGHDKVVQIIVDTKRADLNRAWRGLSPVYIASQNGRDKVVEIFAHTERVDLNQTTNDGATPVFIASQNGHDKVVQILADTKRADLNRAWLGLSPVYIASQNGHDKVVEILAHTERVDLNQTTNDGATPVFIASQNGHDKVVEIFAHTERVDLNQTTNDGATLVFIASQNGHDKVVQILAHIKGVDLNPTYGGATPVFIASQNGHDRVVQILIDAGADPTIKWGHSWAIFSKTPRTIATYRRPFIRKRNPEKYDAYSRIIQTLKLAEQQWKIKNAVPITPVDDRRYSHWDDSESTHLLRHMRRLSVKGVCQ